MPVPLPHLNVVEEAKAQEGAGAGEVEVAEEIRMRSGREYWRSLEIIGDQRDDMRSGELRGAEEEIRGRPRLHR